MKVSAGSAPDLDLDLDLSLDLLLCEVWVSVEPTSPGLWLSVVYQPSAPPPESYRVLQRSTEVYRGLQGSTESYRGLQRFT